MVFLALILMSFGATVWIIAGLFFYFWCETRRRSALVERVRTSAAANVSGVF